VTLNGPGAITVNTGNGVLENDSNNNVTINADLDLVASTSDRFDVSDNGSGTVTFNNITYVGSATNSSGQGLIFNGGDDSKYVINGTFSSSAGVPARLIQYGTGTLVLNGNFNATNPNNVLELDGGTAILGTSKLGTGVINVGGGGTLTPQVLTSGAQTITNAVNVSNYFDIFNPTDAYAGNAVVGGSTADLSTYVQGVNSIASNVTVTAAQNGRVVFGAMTGTNSLGLVKTGLGTVVFSTANTYGTFNGFTGLTAPYLADVQQGTLLINNGTNGSGFGNATGTAQVEAGATLGGNGGTVGGQLTKAMAATAVIAPGDAGQANLGVNPSIGTLDLQGGLEADNGLIMNFKLTGEGLTAGVSNDFLEVSSFTLGGQVTVNLTALNPLETGTGNIYTIFSDGSTFDTETASDFDVIAPTGYALDSSYGNGVGGGYDYTGGVLTVQLVATPEPSTWAMLAGGLILLAVRLRRRASLVG